MKPATDEAVRGVEADAFAACQRGFARAGACTELQGFGYRLGGRPVAVRVAGLELAALIDASLGHLADSEAADDPAALRIDVWDERDCGVRRDSEPGALELPREDPVQVSPGGRYVGHRLPETLTWFDRAAGHVVGCLADCRELSLYELSRPFENPLLLWLRDRGVPLVHAGLVARKGGGALFVGRSGAGKSSAVAACVAAGFELLSDDKAALSEAPEGGFLGHALNASLLLDTASLAAFPQFRESALAPRRWVDTKSLVPARVLAPSGLPREIPIRALFLPRSGVALRTRVRPASRKDALLAVLLGSLLTLPIDRERTPERLAALVETTPAYWLETSSDRSGIPEAVESVLLRRLLRSDGAARS